MEYWEYWTPEEHGRLIENMSAWMDGELPDIANTPEAGGPDDLELEVAEHQACCPSCRALFGELKELRAGFEALPEPAPPEGFAQGVMDRIRAEEKPKVIPLFKRPQFRALAGLAACLVLVAGLYGAVQKPDGAAENDVMPKARGFDQAVQAEDGEGPRVNAALVDPEPADAPQIAAYAASEPVDEVPQTTVPNAAADGLDSATALSPTAIITFERLPEGWEELFPSAASPDAIQISPKEVSAFLRMLEEQGITSEISGSLDELDENSLCRLLLSEHDLFLYPVNNNG